MCWQNENLHKIVENMLGCRWQTLQVLLEQEENEQSDNNNEKRE